GLLVAPARLCKGESAPRDPAGVPQPEALRLHLGVLTWTDPDRAEVVDQVTRPLQLRGAGVRGPPCRVDGVRRGPPGTNCGGAGRPGGGALGATEGIQHLALPAPAQHAMARALRG